MTQPVYPSGTRYRDGVRCLSQPVPYQPSSRTNAIAEVKQLAPSCSQSPVPACLLIWSPRCIAVTGAASLLTPQPNLGAMQRRAAFHFAPPLHRDQGRYSRHSPSAPARASPLAGNAEAPELRWRLGSSSRRRKELRHFSHLRVDMDDLASCVNLGLRDLLRSVSVSLDLLIGGAPYSEKVLDANLHGGQNFGRKLRFRSRKVSRSV